MISDRDEAVVKLRRTVNLAGKLAMDGLLADNDRIVNDFNELVLTARTELGLDTRS